MVRNSSWGGYWRGIARHSCCSKCRSAQAKFLLEWNPTVKKIGKLKFNTHQWKDDLPATLSPWKKKTWISFFVFVSKTYHPQHTPSPCSSPRSTKEKLLQYYWGVGLCPTFLLSLEGNFRGQDHGQMTLRWVFVPLWSTRVTVIQVWLRLTKFNLH